MNVDEQRKRNAILLAVYHRCVTAAAQDALMKLAPAGATAEDLRELGALSALEADSVVLAVEIAAVHRKLSERK